MPVLKSSQKKTASKKTSRKKTTVKKSLTKKAVKKIASGKKKSPEKKPTKKSTSGKKNTTAVSPRKSKTVNTPIKKVSSKKSLSKRTTRIKTSTKESSVTQKTNIKKKSKKKPSLPSPYRTKNRVKPKYFFSTELPQQYNKPFLRAIPRDPSWIFLFWELTPELLKSVQEILGNEKFEKAGFFLRVSDISGITFTGTNALSYTDIEVNLYTNNWYVKVPHPGKTYCIEYGCITADGSFFQILQSNSVQVPRDSISDVIDEEWALSQENDLIQFSAGYNPSSQGPSLFPGSSDNLFSDSSHSKYNQILPPISLAAHVYAVRMLRYDSNSV